jgi:hypothetical protein
VQTPDWTTDERVDYTLRLFHILSALIPSGMDGGVSTSPISYRLWFRTPDLLKTAKEISTKNIILVIEKLIEIHQSAGKLLHLDMEPEPDGLLETGYEFIEWVENDLLPVAIPVIKTRYDVSHQHAEDLVKEHLRLCYDVCHFAVGYEPHKKMIDEMAKRGIKIGKIQISAALRANMLSSPKNVMDVKKNFEQFNEPTYLHQVVAKTTDDKLIRFPDLPDALTDQRRFSEWRAHFHVPIFANEFGLLSSTQDEIAEVLSLQKQKPFTQHMEVETYTWEVLPAELKLRLPDSIARELEWVKNMLDK